MAVRTPTLALPEGFGVLAAHAVAQHDELVAADACHRVHPLIAGEGKALFEPTGPRRGLGLQRVQQLEGGRVSLMYGVG